MQQITQTKAIFPIFNKVNWKDVQKNAEVFDKSCSRNGQSSNNTQTNVPCQEVKSKTEKDGKIRKNYSFGSGAEKMDAALKELKENPNKSFYGVVKKFGVDRKALRERFQGTLDVSAKVGKKPLLTLEEEKIIANHLMEMS